MKIPLLAALLCAAQPQLRAAGIESVIDRLAAAPGARNASWGLSVKELSGREIAARNPRLNLTPASIIKVFVTAAALDKFGPDATFGTALLHDGEVSGGVLRGNIYVRGGGDPSLGSELAKGARPFRQVVEEWASDVSRKAGITSVNGSVLADDSAFDSLQPGSWAWEDIGNYYAARPSALTVNDGMYRLYLKPGEAAGDPAAVLRTEPAVEGLEFENHMKTGPEGSGDNGYIYAFPGSYGAVLRGTVPKGPREFVIKGALPDPPLFAARSLADELSRSGVSVRGGAGKGAPRAGEKLTLISETVSVPLKEIVRVTNKRSFNLYAELLLRHLGAGSPAAGAAAVRDFLAGLGVDVSELKMADACGLSWRNMVKAENFTDLLRAVRGKPYFADFNDSLVFPGDPEATGHVRTLGRGGPLEKNLWLKSGSLNGVRAYTGYLKTKKGKTLAFTSIINNYSMSGGDSDRMHEQLLLALYEKN